MTSIGNVAVSLNINKICRICLAESDNMKSIYSDSEQTELLEENVCTISDVIHRITTVRASQNDGYPNLICCNCIVLLYNAYKFKMQFDRSHKYLGQYLAACIKEELKSEFLDFENDSKEYYDSNAEDSVETSKIVDDSGRRKTSRKQIKKRLGKVKVDVRSSRRRGRRPKPKENFKVIDEESDLEILQDSPIMHPCPICTKEFPALELRAHAHTHRALKKYLSIPNQYKVSPTIKFYATADLYEQNITLHNMPIKLHKCVMCGKSFTADNMRLHLETHRNQKEFKCDQCERVFKKLNHLNTHRVKHLKEFPYKCDQCGKGFVIKTNYDCHVLTHNTNQELPHECIHCLKRFSNPEHLNRHIIIHTENVSYSVKYRVCKCHHCLKTFKDRTELKSHECVPIEQAVNTRFPCKICNKIFKNSSGLYNHNRNIHKLKGAKVLCSVCGNHVSNIYNHMMRHTGEKPFQCNQCGKRFVGKPQLRQHLLVHSGLKPFVCSVCAKAFNNLYNLQVHERIHKGDRCHICTICNKGFLEKSYLKKHMNVHTKL